MLPNEIMGKIYNLIYSALLNTTIEVTLTFITVTGWCLSFIVMYSTYITVASSNFVAKITRSETVSTLPGILVQGIEPNILTYAAHTVAIWTYKSHQKSGFVYLIFKAKFKPAYCRPNLKTFWSVNSDLLNEFFRNCQIHCFLHAVAAIPKKLNSWSHVFVSNHNSNIRTH